MHVFRSLKYPPKRNTFSTIQENAYRPYVILLCFYSAMLYVLLARHQSLLLPGIIGLFSVTLIANVFSLINMRKKIVEIGIDGEHFYLVNLCDIAFRTKVEFYPKRFAGLHRDAGSIYFNYKGEFVRLQNEDWDEVEEIVNQILHL